MYDLIIVGAGPAGLSAALYASRRALKTLVLAKSFGGQTAMNSNIENYPGVENISGLDLMFTFRNQAEKSGAEIINGEIETIAKSDQGFLVVSAGCKEYSAKVIILALGREPRKLNIPGESEFSGKGMVYCATCDAPLFAGKRVAVVGGGNSAADTALLLSKIATQVYLLVRNGALTCEAVLTKHLEQAENVKIIYHTGVEKINGQNFVESVFIKDLNTLGPKELKVDGVFIQSGYQVKADFLGDLVDRNSEGEIVVDNYNRTSVPGIFAAGDVTIVPFKQAIISAGEGAKAALSAYDYVANLPN